MKQYFQQRIFGVHLKQFREKHDLSQFEVAVMCHCTPAHISRLESGKFGDHQMGAILEICDLMSVDVRNYFSDFQEKF